MHTVFVSHAHADNELVDPFVSALRARGVDVWYDRSNLEAGHFLSEEIQQELQNRTALVLMLTPASIESYWVQTELNAFRDLAARDRERVIVPVRLARCEVPVLLRAYTWVEAVDVELDSVLDKLAPALGLPTRLELAAEERRKKEADEAEQRRRAEEVRRAERARVALELAQIRSQTRAHLTADLVVVLALCLAMLAVAGIVLPLVFSGLPSVVMLGGVGLGILLLVLSLIPAVRLWTTRKWRSARKGLSTVLSLLLALTVILTTLFLTKPTIVIPPALARVYSFTYTPHIPARSGGSARVGLWITPFTANSLLANLYGTDPDYMVSFPLWSGCLAVLPDASLGTKAFQPDLCTRVPTVENGDEAPDNTWTILRIDPRAVWSDGESITADDFLFFYKLVVDPHISGGGPFGQVKTVTKLDEHTLKIVWTIPSPFQLGTLLAWSPLPLHVYNRGKYAGVYNPVTGAYNSDIAQQLLLDPTFKTNIPVDSGGFTVQSFTSDQVVLVRSPHHFSNFFKGPFLDSVTFTVYGDDSMSSDQRQALMIQGFKRGEIDLATDFEPIDNRAIRIAGIPNGHVITSPQFSLVEEHFNLRNVAPNAKGNNGVSIFADPNVRKAFFEAFDRCSALKALDIGSCNDPNIRTDELSMPPAWDYDPSVHQPGYNPTDAAGLMDLSGYPVVNGVRRFKDGKTPLTLTLATYTLGTLCQECNPLSQRIVHDLQTNLHIKVNIFTTSDPRQLAAPYAQGGTLATGAFDLAVYFNGYGGPDPMQRLAQLMSQQIPSADNPFGQNFGGVNDPYIDSQIEKGVATLDFTERQPLYRDLMKYIANQNLIESLYIAADVTLSRHTVGNYVQNSVNVVVDWNLQDWYSCVANAGTSSACT
jgi:ABC-type transport system substrate-binding protein